jgi:hypothetical protein
METPAVYIKALELYIRIMMNEGYSFDFCLDMWYSMTRTEQLGWYYTYK